MATRRDPRVQTAPAYSYTKRTLRKPQHQFQLRTRPFQLQPFLCAPVLPGETLRSLLTQARVVTDPLKHPLVGWWKEYFFFYVKHRDLAARDDFSEMMLDPEKDLSAHMTAADPKYYHAGGINWAKLCLERVTEEFFRDEGESWNSNTLEGLPLAQIKYNSWLDSLTLDADKVDRDVDVDLNADGKITANEISKAQMHWEMLRAAGMMDMDYEDYIRTFGVAVREVEDSPNLHRPELIRNVSEWTYPTNHVDPETGVPTTAASWSLRFTADKDRFFSEPGFVLGITTTRPKVYLTAQTGSLIGAMSDAMTWLPALLHGTHEYGYRNIAEGSGPLPHVDDEGGYWVDMRDLFVHGDQFVNYAFDNASSGVALPTATGQRRYAAEAAIDALFANATESGKTIREDGIVTLAIAGRQRDHSPGAAPLAPLQV